MNGFMMGGKLSRTKGHSFERLIAKEFRPYYSDALRVLEYQVAEGVDVAAGPFAIQCKRMKKSIPMNKLFEIQGHEEYFRLLVSKVDREDALVTMTFEQFMKLVFRRGPVEK